jgi:hypothetical protein
VDKLTGGGSFGAILSATGEAKQLQADIRKDLDVLKQAQTTFRTDYTRYQLCRNAPRARFSDPQPESQRGRGGWKSHRQGPMARTQDSLAGLGGIEAELSQRLNLGDDLLKGLKLPF